MLLSWLSVTEKDMWAQWRDGRYAVDVHIYNHFEAHSVSSDAALIMTDGGAYTARKGAVLRSDSACSWL
jgi:hypothetical protein